MASVADPLELRITYEVGEPNLRFRCAAMFYTQGVCAFASVEPAETERPVGTHTSTVRVPPHLLTEGEYTVGLSIFTSRGMKKHFVRATNVATILITDPVSGESARGDYVQALVGVVRPRLEWEIRAGAPAPQAAVTSS